MSESQSFVEAHYYQGGLRHAHFNLGGDRPSWAPRADLPGFRNEIGLSGTDLAIEIIRFEVEGSLVSWFGVYRHSPDAVYGDRQNHSGVGVWLRDMFPAYPEPLAESLQSLIDPLRVGPNERSNSLIDRFLKQALPQYLAPYGEIGGPISGMLAASSPAMTTKAYQIDRENADWGRKLAELVYRIFFLNPCASNEDRVLILLTDGNNASSATNQKLEPFAKKSFSAEFLSLIPKAFEEHVKKSSGLLKELEKTDQIVDKLQAELSQSRTQAADARDRADAAEAQYQKLLEDIQNDDERKRFASISQGISDTNVKMQGLMREMMTLRGELAREILQELRPTLNSLRSERYSPGRETSHHPIRPPTSQYISQERDRSVLEVILPIVLATIGVVAVIALIVLAYQWWS